MIWQNYPHFGSGPAYRIESSPIHRPPGVYINPCAYTRSKLPHLDMEPTLDECERLIVRIFLRRYVTYCARRKRYAAMEGAMRLWRVI